MTERILLAKGIRALAVYFLLLGLSALIATVVRSLFTGPQLVVVASAPSSIVTLIVAPLLFRFADKIAGLVAEKTQQEEVQTAGSDTWDRWILATVVALAVLTSWARDFVRLMAYSIVAIESSIWSLFVVIASLVSLAALFAIGIALVRRTALLTGRIQNARS